MKINFDYDSENDILYFYSGERKVDFSIDYDDTILDISCDKISGVEIMDASEKFAEGEDNVKRIKESLNSIEEAYMGVKYGINSVIVKIGFLSSVPENTREGLLIQVPIKKEMMVEV